MLHALLLLLLDLGYSHSVAVNVAAVAPVVADIAVEAGSV
jgi:hypothetical protein